MRRAEPPSSSSWRLQPANVRRGSPAPVTACLPSLSHPPSPQRGSNSLYVQEVVLPHCTLKLCCLSPASATGTLRYSMRRDGMRCGNRLPDSTGSTDPVEKILVVSTGVPLLVRVRVRLYINPDCRERPRVEWGIPIWYCGAACPKFSEFSDSASMGLGRRCRRRRHASNAAGRHGARQSLAHPRAGSGGSLQWCSHRGASWPAACWPAPAVIRETTVTLL